MRNLLVFAAFLLICQAVYPAELFGTVDALSGKADVADQAGKPAPVSVGTSIYQGQTISSGPDGEVHLVTVDGNIIALRPNTVFRVDEYKADGGSADRIFMSLLKGSIRSITGWIGKFNHSAYRITTPTATIGIRGTDHETTVIDKGDGDEPGTYDTVNEGSTVVKTPQGTATVTPGKFAFAPRDRAIAPFFLVHRPRFLAARRLRIEGRIRQRKQFLRGRLDGMRKDRISRIRLLHGSRTERHGEPGFDARATTDRRMELQRYRSGVAGRLQRTRTGAREPARDLNRGAGAALARWQRNKTLRGNTAGGERRPRFLKRHRRE